jgi:K+-sensing histidine kinase KdpD
MKILLQAMVMKKGVLWGNNCINTGSGIEEKYMERILSRFLPQKEVGKGTGLGLSIVYGQ